MLFEALSSSIDQKVSMSPLSFLYMRLRNRTNLETIFIWAESKMTDYFVSSELLTLVQ